MSPTLSAGGRVGRWSLRRALGSGSFGTTWEATDDRGRVAALKVLGEAPGREVEALARVCHPGVPAVLDAGGAPVPFLAMCLARGRSLASMIRVGAAGEAPAAAVAVVLADALAAVHHAGIAHGDVKPDNILVGSVRRQEVMLVDFGMAGAEAGGTLAYAAPERLRGGPPTPAADVYALGLILFEMVSGALPFADRGLSASLSLRRTETPTLAASPWLAGLVTEMLAPEPHHRPSAAAVVDRLAAHGAPLAQLTPDQVRARARTVHVPVEADGPVDAWAASGGAVLVQGAPGAGRTHQLDRALVALQARGAVWLRLRPQATPWGPVRDALQDPALATPPRSLPDQPHLPDRAEAAAAALEERAPTGLFLLVDDLDDHDAGTRAVVEALVRRGAVAVLASGQATPTQAAWSLTPLRSFAEDDVQALITALLGDEGLEPLARTAASIAGGAPGLVVEVVVRAVSRGALVRRAGRWIVDTDALSALESEGVVRAGVAVEPGSLAARVGGLLGAAGVPQPAERLAPLLDADPEAVEAALGRLVDAGYVGAARGRVCCVSQAVGAALVEASGCGRWLHQRLWDAVQRDPEASTARRLRHLIGTADAALAGRVGPGLLQTLIQEDATVAARVADQLWALSPLPALVPLRVDALRRAGRIDEAIAFGEQERVGSPSVALLVALAEAQVARGDGGDKALEAVAAAREALGDASLPPTLRLVEAKARFREDDLQGAIAVCVAAPPVRPDSPADAVDAWLSLQVVHAQARHRNGTAADGVAVLESIPDALGYGRSARALLDSAAGRLLYHAGRLQEAAQRMAIAAAEDAGLSALDRARTLNNAGLVAYQSGRRMVALRHWEQALVLFERLGAAVERVRVSVNLCVGYREAGRWERGRQAGTWAVEESRRQGLHELECMAAGNLGDLMLDQRRFVDAERWFLVASRLACKHDLAGEAIELARRQAELAVRRDDPDALLRADEALQLADGAGATIEACRARGLRAVCLARRGGSPELIHGLLDDARGPLQEAGAAGDLACVRLLSAEALIALREGEHAIAECDRVAVFAEEMGLVALRTRADQLLAEARTITRANRDDDRLQLLVSLAVAVARHTEDRAGLLATLAEAALDLLKGDRSFVLVLDGEGDEPVVAARHAAAGAEGGKPSMSVVRRVLESRTEVIVGDVAERADLRDARSVSEMCLRSAMCVPMVEGDRLLGAIYVDSRAATEEELSRSAQYMRALAAHAAIAVAAAERMEALRRRAAWAAEVAHDMRGPVSSIVTIAETVREEPDDVELVEECMDDVLLAARRSLAMAERFLSNATSQRAPMEVADWVRGVCRTLAPQASRRGVRLEWSGGAGLAVLGDSVELGRVLLNLVSNGIKYSDDGGRVEVRAEERGDALLLTVRDHGPGVPEQALPTIFGRGVQAPGAREGHGIGLSVVARLVESHGGQIAAENAADGGARFTVTLPLHEACQQAS